jgi:hypothetical protein
MGLPLSSIPASDYQYIILGHFRVGELVPDIAARLRRYTGVPHLQHLWVGPFLDILESIQD